MSVINTNITALIGQNNLSNSQSMLAKAQERLSSGLRINSASDDAAGQAIANKMTAQIKGMDQASRNASDGISLVQTMEGGLDQINDNLQRIRELAVQGANDTNAAEDRDAIVTEINERLAEIDRVAGSNNFNGTNLLNVSGGGTLNIQVGSNTETEDVISVTTLNATVEGLDLDSAAGGVITAASGGAASQFQLQGTSGGGAATNAHGDFQALVDAVDTATETLDTNRATLGATLNRFDSVIDNLATTSTNLSEARSRIEDADYAVEVSNMTRANILQQAGTSMLAQANQTPQSVLSLLG
ncbi:MULTISPECIES: flagellin N-terminal helical domain-containing protein [Halomonadaceae]|uniref:flagellin N-terminal helical domain-containing protein n=1 Tax=Halomonadaceae TaxID=28256 RepID=UPI0012F184A2|nr:MULTISPECIES: flagellin [Halomonas]CAD5257139.1 Flagellin [Halomonas sp. 59]CAD5257371.1 Flagellin [Halomonas sp. 113]CAD5271215.1 Flagellin [Halomonas sp. I3]CAD5291491.1 Flagellin [Halomonas sp. 156]VXB23695.1 Flagellin [Halomonas titanicae]